MNRTEWEACNDPLLLLAWLRERGNDRKFCLFASVCLRRILPIFREHDLDVASAIQSLEYRADGLPLPYSPPYRGMWTLVDPEREQVRRVLEVVEQESPWNLAVELVKAIRELFVIRAPGHVLRRGTLVEIGTASRLQADLIRDQFGYFHHPDPLWLSRIGRLDEIVTLARVIWTENSWHEVPILGDALEDAGCTDEQVLEHCRTTEHARGCWVVDAILGKR